MQKGFDTELNPHNVTLSLSKGFAQSNLKRASTSC